jgi:hypothetical protein
MGGLIAKKTLTFFTIILLCGIPFHSTLSAHQKITNLTENITIEVEIFNIHTKEKNTINLHPEHLQKLTDLFKKIENENNKIGSIDKKYLHYNQLLNECEELLKLDKKTVYRLHKSFQRIYLLNKVNKNIISNHPEKQDSNNTNYLCYINGNTNNTATFRIHNILPEPILEWIRDRIFPPPPFPLPLWMVLLIMITIYPLSLLTNFIIPKLSSLSPVNFLTVLTLGTTWTPSYGQVYSDGINGKKEWHTPLYGKIGYDQRLYENLPAAYYPAIVGFSGIKINLGEVTGPFHLIHKQVFFGTAVMVSIDNGY